MGAVAHLKTLCCLGLTPESAMIAVTPLLHEIIPHGATRAVLFEPDATVHAGYAENPATTAIWLEHAWRFMNDRTSPMSLWMPGFRAAGIGWTLHLQGRGWLECGWYRDVETPLDSCWILDAAIADGSRTIAGMHLTRPRSTRPFTFDDVQRLDRLRRWLAHAFRRALPGDACREDQGLPGTRGAPVLSGQMILTSEAKLVFQTAGLAYLLRILPAGGSTDLTRNIPAPAGLPAPILKLLRSIIGAADGASHTPPRMRISTAFGVLTLEAKWLVPAGTLPADAAREPKSCLIAVTIGLREHAVAHAARILRERGATPAQVNLGIALALGKTKPMIANELGLKLATVASLTRKLHQTLDIRNSTELATKIWLGQKQAEARQGLRRVE